MSSTTILSACSILLVILTIPACTGTQLCISSCHFELDFTKNLTLPLNCTFVQREQCDVVIIFDYSTRMIDFQFGTQSKKHRLNDEEYTSDNIVHTVITLDGNSGAQQVIEYYCSTGDRCEYKYALEEALPRYLHKTCHLFRAKVIALLHSDPTSTSRACLIEDGTEVICNNPCELFYTSPNKTLRSCDAQRNLEFQTSVGRSTPTSKPEYDHRLYAYACTTQGCNGFTTQGAIESLILADDGECLTELNNNQTTSGTTNTASTTTASVTQTTTGNGTGRSHANIVSNVLMLLIHCFFILLL